jgi:hypothetical protein
MIVADPAFAIMALPVPHRNTVSWWHRLKQREGLHHGRDSTRASGARRAQFRPFIFVPLTCRRCGLQTSRPRFAADQVLAVTIQERTPMVDIVDLGAKANWSDLAEGEGPRSSTSGVRQRGSAFGNAWLSRGRRSR